MSFDLSIQLVRASCTELALRHQVHLTFFSGGLDNIYLTRGEIPPQRSHYECLFEALTNTCTFFSTVRRLDMLRLNLSRPDLPAAAAVANPSYVNCVHCLSTSFYNMFVVSI